MMILLYSVHVLICFFLIAVVLLQQGKGADLSVFGGGATQTAFGARGAATVLHKMTVISFVLFIVTTLSIGIIQSEQGKSDIFKDLDDDAATAATGDSDKAASATDEAATDAAAEAPAEEPQGAFSSDAAEDGTEDASATDGGGAAEATEDGAPADAAAGDSAPVEAADPDSGG
jgi:preprotein translocase subunit SecG